MPHSPLTRFLAILIVIAFALVLFLPADASEIGATYALGALPFILGAFTWSVVRGAAPFDDRAFHRTLPPGDSGAFLRVSAIHLALLAGIALAVTAYCLAFNFLWPVMAYGILFFTVPVWAFASAVGITASISSAKMGWRAGAWLAIFISPIVSAYALNRANGGFIGEAWRPVYFPPGRTVVLSTAFLYPLIWWLVAVGRRKTLGLLLCAATGVLLPWLCIYGNFFPIRAGQKLSIADLRPSSLDLARKPLPLEPRNWLEISTMLEPQGLGEGEFAILRDLTAGSLSGERADKIRGEWYNQLNIWELRDPSDLEKLRIRRSGPIYVGQTGGRIVWGQQGVWEYLRTRMPPHDTFEYWSPELNRPATVGMEIFSPPVAWTADPILGETDVNYLRLGESTWEADLSGAIRWEPLGGEFRLAEGGSFRLKEGGIVKVSPLKQEGGQSSFSIKWYVGSHFSQEGPWFAQTQNRFNRFAVPRIMLLDESGKHAYALDTIADDSPRAVVLGEMTTWGFSTEQEEAPQTPERQEILRKARIYIFMPVSKELDRKIVLPPP